MRDADRDRVSRSLQVSYKGVDIGRGVRRGRPVVVGHEDMHCWSREIFANTRELVGCWQWEGSGEAEQLMSSGDDGPEQTMMCSDH